jgi:hypothetical protein
VRPFTLQDPFEPVSRGFRERAWADETLTWILLAAVGAAVALALLLALLSRQRDPGRRLFRRLSDASGLSGAERSLLRRVAARASADNWSLLFFRRSLFEESAAGLEADPREIDRVRRKLYAP